MNKPSPWIVAGPLLVLLMAASEARDRRYRDQEDGTVKDTRSGLVWLAHANCLGAMSWERAKAQVAELQDGMCGLTDGSEPGDWRLPTLVEWEAIVECSCGEIVLTDDRGTGCYTDGMTTFHDVQASDYWSATPRSDGRTIEVMSLSEGVGGKAASTASLPVWSVRRTSDSGRLTDGG